uniref:Kazal-like domain-containing protein n=1 Tax=Graphocephala atropunctata TaxID=36148 RepID=A0A1B6KMJ0_9HEMI
MQPTTILCCLIFVLAAVMVDPGSSQVMSFRTSTPLSPRKQRLPYTPVRDSQHKKKLLYTPVKSAGMRQGMVCRQRTTTRRPFPLKTTAKPCNCNCNLSDYQPLCASDKTDRDTFVNECQLECYNCTCNKNYQVLYKGECK